MLRLFQKIWAISTLYVLNVAEVRVLSFWEVTGMISTGGTGGVPLAPAHSGEVRTYFYCRNAGYR